MLLLDRMNVTLILLQIVHAPVDVVLCIKLEEARAAWLRITMHAVRMHNAFSRVTVTDGLSSQCTHMKNNGTVKQQCYAERVS